MCLFNLRRMLVLNLLSFCLISVWDKKDYMRIVRRVTKTQAGSWHQQTDAGRKAKLKTKSQDIRPASDRWINQKKWCKKIHKSIGDCTFLCSKICLQPWSVGFCWNFWILLKVILKLVRFGGFSVGWFRLVRWSYKLLVSFHKNKPPMNEWINEFI